MTTATASATAPTTIRTTDFRMVGLDQLHESPRNPRKHFNQAKLEELSRSIEVSGILTPLTVRPRPTGSGYEIAAGHRRRRAALLVAQRTDRTFDVPCVVREGMTDAEFMEVLVVENGQREDVHPLEEAQGYFELMREEIGYDVAKIGERVGRSKDYVYDRLKLLNMVAKAKELFLEDRFTLAHAIILARLSPEWQKRAIGQDEGDVADSIGYDGGLFRSEHAGRGDLLDEEEPENLYDGLKPCSVREFQHWVDTNVRFDTEAPDVQDLFPDTSDKLIGAEEAALKVIHITQLFQVPPEARDEGQRTYTNRAWQRADGQEDSKECEHSVLGVVVVGPGRGDSFQVCIAKEKCTVHYGDRIREKAKREREGSKNGASSAQAKQRAAEERDDERRKREQAAQQLQQARWKKSIPAIADAVAERVRKASIGTLVDVFVEVGRLVPAKRAAELVPLGRTADDALRYFAFGKLYGYLSNEWQMEYAAKLAKGMGVDVRKILDEVAPIEKAAAGKGGK